MKKILLIEDNNELSKIKEEELKKHLPYSLITIKDFNNIQITLETYENDLFIALLDYQQDHIKTCDAVKFLSSKSIPTIVYDDKYSAELREDVLLNGALEYLLKKKNSDLLYSARLVDRVYKNHFIKAIIVDGSASFKDELSTSLAQFGLHTIQASDAVSAMNLLKKHPEVKIILIDDDIKGNQQGIDLVEDIRSKYSSEELAVLGISSHGYNSSYSIEFLKKGANDFIIKPFIKEQLLLRVMQELEMLNTVDEKRKLATTDFLTKLNNRRSLDTIVPSMIKYAKEMKRSLSVAMIDIDNFKLVNDTHGHAIGDEVLKHISKLLKNNFRQDDLIVRNGGEEFCVIIDNINKEKSIEVLESLRKDIEKTAFKNETVTLSITVSIGLFYGLKDTIEEMLDNADKLLYEAKHKGRNCLVS